MQKFFKSLPKQRDLKSHYLLDHFLKTTAYLTVITMKQWAYTPISQRQKLLSKLDK
jgi:hypothetical protein